MKNLTKAEYEQLENYWRFYEETYKSIDHEKNAKKKAESERIIQVIEQQFLQMDEEEQGAFGMAMRTSIDVDEAEGFPLDLEQLDFVKKRVLKETARLLKNEP